MKKISLQWRLTCIITLYIAIICACLTLLVYKNGIYYIDSLQETVDARGDDAGDQGGDGAAAVFHIPLPENYNELRTHRLPSSVWSGYVLH